MGFIPKQSLWAQSKEVFWEKQVRGLGVAMDAGLAMSSHLSQMRPKSRSALTSVATAARIAALSWEDFARVVPIRVLTKACHGMALVVVNPDAEHRLNALQREWGAALFGLHPGMPLFCVVSGWKLLVELGWRARLYLEAVVQAIMLEERAALSHWPLLHAVLRRSTAIPGGWQFAVNELRERFGVPPFDRVAAQAASSGDAQKARMRRYRKTIVEPLVFGLTEDEMAEARRRPGQEAYAKLHPGRGPVAGVLKGHGWGPDTMPDYRRWARLRLVMRVHGRCPECDALDGTAEHILAHTMDRVRAAGHRVPAEALDFLRTDVPADQLRRHVRAVGQTLRGGQDWKWLSPRPPAGRDAANAGTPPGSPGLEVDGAGPG
jgi:hypothetical protein